MDLFINTFGSRIRRRHEQITVEIPKEKTLREYPIKRIERILIMGNSSISSDAIRLAMKHGVDISYIGSFGKPEARIVPAIPTGSTKVRHAQFRVALTGDAFSYAKRFVLGKIENQIRAAVVLNRDETAVARMREAMDRAARTENVGALMSAEGFAAEQYFSGAWSHVFNGFGRDQRGNDRVNAALNYGYGILYNEAERAILYAGLDPFIGLLHSERYGKPSLTLDFVEEFRVAAVDAAVLTLFANSTFTARDTITAEGRESLSPYGRKKVVRAVFTALKSPIRWNGCRQKLSDIITEQAKSLARSLLEETPTYEAFVAPPEYYEESILSDHPLVEKPKPKTERIGQTDA